MNTLLICLATLYATAELGFAVFRGGLKPWLLIAFWLLVLAGAVVGRQRMRRRGEI